MPLITSVPLPPLAESILALLESYPEMNATQRIVLRTAAALIAEDTLPDDAYFDLEDERIRFSVEEFELFPDRWELIGGKATPKFWATPKREADGEEDENEATKPTRGDAALHGGPFMRPDVLQPLVEMSGARV